MTIFNSVADVNNLVATFKASSKTRLSSSNQLAVSSRSKLYEMLGEAKIACDALLDKANSKHYAKALLQAQIKTAKPGKNKYGPAIKLLFGNFNHSAPKVEFEKEKGLTLFEPDRSAEKYASVMWWFDHMNITTDHAKALEDFDGHMDGAIKDAREAMKPKPAVVPAKLIAERVKLLKEETPSQTLEVSFQVPADQGTYVALWGEVVDGKVIVRGHLPAKSDFIAKHVERIATAQEAELSKMRDARVAREEQQKALYATAAEMADEIADQKLRLMVTDPAVFERFRKEHLEKTELAAA